MPRWYFTKEELAKIPSIKDGLDPKEELKLRQQAAGFIQDMGNRLNHGVRDGRSRISQLCQCSAMIYMHRFFVIHSFKKFDARDVAAACLFLAGKSEECPRKLEHLVRAWFAVKFNVDDKQVERAVCEEAADYLVLLESVILQTIAFDLLIALPHPLVLNAMEKLVRGDKKQTETAYYFATDLLYTTNWCVRYPVNTLACLCIQLACLWAEYQIPQQPGKDPWYKMVDANMTEELLLELTDEFTGIYRECDMTKVMAIKRFADKNRIPLAAASNRLPSVAPSPVNPSATLPPPPPPPPCLPAAADDVKPEPAKMRKLGLSEYRERRIQATGSATSTPPSTSAAPAARQSFIPDFSKASMQGDVPEVTLPAGIPLATVKTEKVKVEVVEDILTVKQEIPEPRQSSSQKYRPERQSDNGLDPDKAKHHKQSRKRSRSRERQPPPPPMEPSFMPRSPPPPPPPEPPMMDLEDGELQ